MPDPPVDAGGGRRHLSSSQIVDATRGRGQAPASSRSASSSSPARRRRRRRARARRSTTGSPPCRSSWNIVPNGRDAIMGMEVPLADSVFPTVVYRRYSAHWRKPLPNAPRDERRRAPHPGPADPGARRRPPARPLQEHGHAAPRPALDALPRRALPAELRRRLRARLLRPRTANVKPGQTCTYRLTAGEDSAGVWPYHDHSPSMMDSIAGGMYGMLSILGRDEHAPDREFEVVLAPMGKLQDDRRPRLRRQHAGLPREGRRRSCSGT